jgi:protein SCO1
MELWDALIVYLHHQFTKILVAFMVMSMMSCQVKEEKSITDHSLPFYNDATFAADWIEKNDEKYQAIHKVDAFGFLDQTGSIVSNKTLEGKIYTVNFFFTVCPSICPKMTANLHKIQDAFLNDKEIEMVSFSVMPWHDTVEVLNNYGRDHNIQSEKWHLLTGDREKIYALGRKSYFVEKSLGLQKSNNDFLHTETVLLIDKHSRIRGIYNATLPVDMGRIIEDIGILKNEGD